MSKPRGVITENIILLKYQKQAITVAVNGKDALMFLSTVLEKLWSIPSVAFYCQSEHFADQE